MPIVLVVAVALVGWWMMQDGNPMLPGPDVQTFTGYVSGQPIELVCKSIGYFGFPPIRCYLRADAADAWNKMVSAAELDGVNLQPEGSKSAFRTQEVQALMLEERPDYAAALNHSPHQEGIAVDVDGIPSGSTDASSPVLAWLHANAADFGWAPLSPKGAAKEPWHWEFSGGGAALVS